MVLISRCADPQDAPSPSLTATSSLREPRCPGRRNPQDGAADPAEGQHGAGKEIVLSGCGFCSRGRRWDGWMRALWAPLGPFADLRVSGYSHPSAGVPAETTGPADVSERISHHPGLAPLPASQASLLPPIHTSRRFPSPCTFSALFLRCSSLDINSIQFFIYFFPVQISSFLINLWKSCLKKHSHH